MSKHEEEEFSIEDIFKDFPDDDGSYIVKDDMVNRPPHYNAGGIECIDAILAATNHNKEGYLQGNVLKYTWRENYKNKIEDLKKASWYLNRLIDSVE